MKRKLIGRRQNEGAYDCPCCSGGKPRRSIKRREKAEWLRTWDGWL